MGLIDFVITVLYIWGVLSFFRLMFKRDATKQMLTTDIIIVTIAVIVWLISGLI